MRDAPPDKTISSQLYLRPIKLSTDSRTTSHRKSSLLCCRWVKTEIGEKNVLFEPSLYINDHFTKTGSGQTWEKLQKSKFFSDKLEDSIAEKAQKDDLDKAEDTVLDATYARTPIRCINPRTPMHILRLA